jgi:hypothetical protein
MRPRRPYGRTWTLAELDREIVYRLWYDELENRWEVRAEHQAEGTLVTRVPVQSRTRGPQPGRAAGRPAGGAPGLDGNADAVPTTAAGDAPARI